MSDNKSQGKETTVLNVSKGNRKAAQRSNAKAHKMLGIDRCMLKADWVLGLSDNHQKNNMEVVADNLVCLY